MPGQRAERVGRQVLQEISTIVDNELRDPRLALVTFTAARMTPDLRTAWIYYSCMGDEDRRRGCQQGLSHAAPYLRREIGRRLRLRYVPALRFEFDDSLERAERISKLLGSGGGEGDR